MISILMLLMISNVTGFFNPSIKVSSGREITLNGNGPPVVFSSGLFGTMPAQFYSSFINEIKKNMTVVTFNDFGLVNKKDFEDVVDTLGVTEAGFVSHSTFSPEVLSSDYLSGAVLCDPIILPKINLFGGQSNLIKSNAATLAIKAEKTYESEFSVPDFQIPMMTNDYSEEIYSDVGHIDILDDFWANVGMQTNFWQGPSSEKISFKSWNKNKLNTGKTNIKKIRETYRKFIASKISNFFMDTKDEILNVPEVEVVVNPRSISKSTPIDYYPETPLN